jgi:hypothetical protein
LAVSEDDHPGHENGTGDGGEAVVVHAMSDAAAHVDGVDRFISAALAEVQDLGAARDEPFDPPFRRLEAGDIVIEGRLDLGALNGTARPVEIVWVLRREGAESSMGDLRQANRVPQARIDAGWPALADTIAGAATPGLLEIIRANAGDP